MSSLKGKAVRGEDRTCSYEASCAGRGTDGRRSKMLVGVYDSKLGTLTLHPAAENGTVFALSQTVKSYKGTGSSEIKATEAGMSYADKRRALFDSFGTVRKQRSLKSHEASIVSVDNVVGSGRGMMGAVERQEQSRSNREAMDRAVERARDGGDDGDHSKVREMRHSRIIHWGGTISSSAGPPLNQINSLWLRRSVVGRKSEPILPWGIYTCLRPSSEIGEAFVWEAIYRLVHTAYVCRGDVCAPSPRLLFSFFIDLSADGASVMKYFFPMHLLYLAGIPVDCSMCPYECCIVILKTSLGIVPICIFLPGWCY